MLFFLQILSDDSLQSSKEKLPIFIMSFAIIPADESTRIVYFSKYLISNDVIPDAWHVANTID